jgi:hypothetical protein
VGPVGEGHPSTDGAASRHATNASPAVSRLYRRLTHRRASGPVQKRCQQASRVCINLATDIDEFDYVYAPLPGLDTTDERMRTPELRGKFALCQSGAFARSSQ